SSGNSLAAGVRVIPYRERDDFAILNSIPSAEGALQVAMENLPVTLHGSTALVLGLGRTGLTLARMLCGLGARTVVVARNPAQLARAAEMGCCPVPLRNLGAVIREGTVVFNTIPALVLNREVLGKAQPELLIIDLASAPGGTDFAGAGELGLKTIWALGLPGKVAPRTAGRAIFQVVASFLAREFPEEFADVKSLPTS
ncbi:MAG: dipicolinic acid synthetase subunit A, partial [Firmicutes bacterium]|nr:dipicolinic acid synthetase subunit A [Bacillota bacterium]